MKRERIQLINILRAEIHSPQTSLFSTMRRNFLIVGFFAIILFASKGGTDAHLSFSTSLPFLRGGYTAFAPPTSKPIEMNRRPNLFGIGYLHRSINTIGHKIQSETSKQWDGITDNVGRELGKIKSAIENIFANNQRQGTRKLDEVLNTFSSVLRGNDIDTAQLLKACRAHLILMKSGGAALRVVAKDMEANLNKAESLFKNLSKDEGKYISSLLEVERNSGIHDGNILKDASAAMGLLWIRRSLTFQLDLYTSLIHTNGKHPKDAAFNAYTEHLSPFHGWMLQKVFPASLTQIPDRRVFIAKFGGTEVDELDEEYEKEIVRKLKSLVSTWEPIINTWKNEYERLDLEDTRRA